MTYQIFLNTTLVYFCGILVNLADYRRQVSEDEIDPARLSRDEFHPQIFIIDCEPRQSGIPLSVDDGKVARVSLKTRNRRDDCASFVRPWECPLSGGSTLLIS